MSDQSAAIKKNLADRAWYRLLISVLTLLFLVSAALYGAGAIICYGPFKMARDVFVMSLLESDSLGPLARLYLSEGAIYGIVSANGLHETGARTDASLIKAARQGANRGDTGIEVHDIAEGFLKGKMMVIADPSRVVFVFGHDDAGSKAGAETLIGLVERYGGVGGVSVGVLPKSKDKGDADPDEDGARRRGGHGDDGILISEAALIYGDADLSYDIAGFDPANKLIIGNMTIKEALDKKLRDAAACGPALIVNGKAMETSGVSSGLGPRIAMGQRADGTVLLLVADGLRADSAGLAISDGLGARLSDVIDIMLRHSAVNAVIVDCGSAYGMAYGGERVDGVLPMFHDKPLTRAVIVR